MHLRRAAAFLLGAWIVGCLFMAYLDFRGPQSTEAILSRPTTEIAQIIKMTGRENVEKLLNHHEAEEAREYMRDWGIAQLMIGAGLIALLVYATHVNRLAVGLGLAMLVLAVFGYFVLAPELTFLGRGLESTPGWSANRARYLALRGTFLMVEAVKLALGCILAGYLFVFKTPRAKRLTETPPGEVAQQPQDNAA